MFTKIILFAFPCYIINDQKIYKIWKILIKKFDYFIVSLGLLLLLLKKLLLFYFLCYICLLLLLWQTNTSVKKQKYAIKLLPKCLMVPSTSKIFYT